MRTISIHVSEDVYERFKHLAADRGRPAAELIRDAMEHYVASHERAHSILDIEAHDSGPLLSPWTRAELLDEMLGER